MIATYSSTTSTFAGKADGDAWFALASTKAKPVALPVVENVTRHVSLLSGLVWFVGVFW